jgi:ABC-type nitrate/sulfonate/bicarbonate transport system substrate-binding protein
MATKVVISAPRPAPFFAPFFVMIDQGFLAEQDIDGEIRYQAGLAELVKGEVDFATGMSAYKQFLNGMPVRQLASISSRESSHVLMARPKFDSPLELKHILIPGGSGPQSERFITELTNILAIHGINLEESETIHTQGVPGSHKEQWDMLQEGIGDAATLGAPWSQIAAREGFKHLGHESNFSPSPSGAGLYVSPETIERDPALVRAVVRAYVRAMQYCQENMAGTMDVMLKYCASWGVTSEDIAKGAYEEVAPYWRLEVDKAVLDRAMRRVCDQKGLPYVAVGDFLQTEFLEEVLGN